MSENSLIAAKEESATEWYSGVSLFDTVSDLSEAISSGSWLDAGLGMAGLAAEGVALVVDPLGTLASYGVGWLIDHCQPLQDALDWIAGDPEQIAAYAKTWSNVSAKIAEAAATHKSAVESDIAAWTGAAATAYKTRAAETSDALNAAVQAASAASTAIEMAGMVVSAVRDTVKDLIAQTVGRLAVWAAEALFSLGTAAPLIAVQATAYIAKVTATISKLFARLAKTMSKLKPLLARLKTAFQSIVKKLKGKDGKTDLTTGSKKNTKTGDKTDDSTKPASTDTTKPASTDPSKTDNPKQDTNPTNPAKNDGDGNPTTPANTTKEKNGTPENRSDPDKKVLSKAEENGTNNTRKPEITTTCGDPVDTATGEFLLPATDLELPGVLPLILGRRHRSAYAFGRWFGPTWSATLDMRIVIEQRGITFLGEDGLLLVFPHTVPDQPIRTTSPGQRMTMSRTETGAYQVFDPDRELTWHFSPAPALNGLDTRLGNYAITAITDRHHNRIQFHYNADGAPTEITHSGGYHVRIDTAEDRVTALTVLGTNPDGTEIATLIREFGYTAGQLTAVTNGVGATTTFTYDDAGRMLSWTDSNANTLHNTYDTAGRVVAQEGTNGFLSARFEYTSLPEGSRTKFTNSLGAATTYTFDDQLRLRETIDASNASTSTDFNEFHQPTRHVTPDGAITSYEYSEDGDLLTFTRADDATISVEYAEPRRAVAVTDVDAKVTRHEYDGQGDLTATIDHGGIRTSYIVHPGGALASITESTGARTLFEVDAAGLPTTVTNPYGAATHVVRDHLGRPTTVTDALGGATHLEWSSEGKLLSRLDPDGHTQQWEWDGEGNLLTHVDQAGGVTRYRYGAFDQLLTRAEPDASVTHYVWDTERQLIGVVNPLRRSWAYRYDAVGRVNAEVDYTGAETRYSYDSTGRLSTSTTPTGVTLHHSYDVLGRLIEIHATTGEWIRYQHDRVGRITQTSNGTGHDTTHRLDYTHTPSGQLSSVQVDSRPITTYSYDIHDRRTARATAGGATTQWSLDIGGRVTTQSVDEHTIVFTHDASNRRTGWQLGALSQHQTLTPAGRVVSREITTRLTPQSPGSRQIRHDAYTRRADGYITSQTTTRPALAPVHREYQLDLNGRVTTLDTNGHTTEKYSYDALANITSALVNRHYGNQNDHDSAAASPAAGNREYLNNLLIRDGRTRYFYDAAGRLIRKEKARISRQPDIWHYRYDAFDHLTDIFTPDQQWWRYTYDSFGRRLTKSRHSRDGHILESTEYSWDATTLIEEQSEDSTTRWTYQPDTYTPLTQEKRTSSKREFVVIATDLVGTPTDLIDPTDGRVLATAVTDLWGETSWRGVTSTILRFPGQTYDHESGLHYNLHRYYDAHTGRYLTQDPLGLPPAPNPNTYPRNPVVGLDPLGLTPCSEIKRIKRMLGRAGMSVSDYDIVYTPSLNEDLKYGNSPHVAGKPLVGPTGRPLIEVGDIAFRSEGELIKTIFHEVWHHEYFKMNDKSVGGSHDDAEKYGEKMYTEFLRRTGAR
ncbi:DUF6531 domain-containing protein [Nocardia sp. NPDC048505]|uniref:DUF6531 domain-containing protein n=1 Tax=unclassified Nocardia TaxID=2637762 RepID=UPI00340AF6DB